jgi:hypothetical protein
LSKPGAFFLLILPVAAIEIVANKYRDGIGSRDFGGWSLLTYLAKKQRNQGERITPLERSPLN